MPVTEAAFFHKNRPQVKNVKVSLTEKLRNFYANKCCFYDSQVKKKIFFTPTRNPGKCAGKFAMMAKISLMGLNCVNFDALGSNI